MIPIFIESNQYQIFNHIGSAILNLRILFSDLDSATLKMEAIKTLGESKVSTDFSENPRKNHSSYTAVKGVNERFFIKFLHTGRRLEMPFHKIIRNRSRDIQFLMYNNL